MSSLSHPLTRWTEPIILILIIISTVIFIIQASTPPPEVYFNPPVVGYFHQWEDYAIFSLFVLFTWVAAPPDRPDGR